MSLSETTPTSLFEPHVLQKSESGRKMSPQWQACPSRLAAPKKIWLVTVRITCPPGEQSDDASLFAIGWTGELLPSWTLSPGDGRPCGGREGECLRAVFAVELFAFCFRGEAFVRGCMLALGDGTSSAASAALLPGSRDFFCIACRKSTGLGRI